MVKRRFIIDKEVVPLRQRKEELGFNFRFLGNLSTINDLIAVSYTHLRAHET